MLPVPRPPTLADMLKHVLRVLALVVLGLPLANNFVSTRSVGAVAVVTTVLKISALAIVAVVGLVLFDPGNVGPVREHDGAWAAALPGVRLCTLSTATAPCPPSRDARDVPWREQVGAE